MKNSKAMDSARRGSRAWLRDSGSSFVATAVAEDPKEFAEPDKTAFGSQGNSKTKCKSKPQWTDQKHNLYLKSIEASFVNQLYNSAEVLPTRGSACNGCWRRLNFERSNPELHRNRLQEGGDFVANPWNEHFRFASKHQSSASTNKGADSIKENMFASCALATSSKEDNLSRDLIYREYTVNCSAEVSDQNFLDDDIEYEDENPRSNRKRTRASMSDGAHIDQIVPVRGFPSGMRAARLC